ncbi:MULTISPECIES: hypothetical protein [Nocardia]|uniref:hypothetical protein n=1 Tax=Nocardia TaxID=1817 RepID=UPI001300934C|nr:MULTISPECIES: hypothetical protein [Nocardia]
MSTVVEHPAVEIARQRVADFDPDLSPVAIAVRPGVAAVVLDSADKRFTVFVEDHDGEWVAPTMLTGTPRRIRERASVTGTQPLYCVSNKWFGRPSSDGEPEVGWFSVTGLAELDAAEVVITSVLETSTTLIGESGLAFGIVRANRDEKPVVEIRTRDGRLVPVRP